MAPPQPCHLNESALSLLKKLDEKPVLPACRSLFGSPDPSETRRMLVTAMSNETRRVKDEWNFDPLWLQSAGKRGQRPGETLVPSPTKGVRYLWETVDGASVPQFYVRPPRKHHSELRLAHEAKRQRLAPLQARDQNASPRPTYSIEPSKHVSASLKFANPPQITASNVNPSMVRVVAARRVPLPTETTAVHPQLFTSDVEPRCSRTTPDESSCPKAEDSSSEASTVPIPASTETSDFSVKSPFTCLVAKGSKRQLFGAKSKEQPKKRPRTSACTTASTARGAQQRLITEMMPQRKFRPSATKTAEDTKSLSDEAVSSTQESYPSQRS